MESISARLKKNIQNNVKKNLFEGLLKLFVEAEHFDILRFFLQFGPSV